MRRMRQLRKSWEKGPQRFLSDKLKKGDMRMHMTRILAPKRKHDQ